MNYFKTFHFSRRRGFKEEKMQEIHLFTIHSLKLKYQHVWMTERSMWLRNTENQNKIWEVCKKVLKGKFSCMDLDLKNYVELATL